MTGREADHWLVMTVGVLITAMAITLLVGAWQRQPSLEVTILAIAAAIGLAGIDVIYAARQVISPIYLVDAGAELLIIAAWGFAVSHRPGAKWKLKHEQ